MRTRIDELSGDLEALRTEINELDALEEPTEEQVARYDAALVEWDTKKDEHDKLVARAEKLETIRSASLEPQGRVEIGAPAVIVRTDPFDNVASEIRLRHDEQGNVRMAADDVIERAHRAFEDVKHRGVRDEHIERLLERVDTVPGAAEHALLHGTQAYRAAFDSFFAAGKRGMAPVYTEGEAEAVRAALALGGSTGGYTLPTLLDPTLIHTGTATKNPIRSIARIVEGTQNVWHGVSVGNVTTAWTSEGSATADGSPTFSNPSVTAAKLTAFITGSYEIFEDSNLQAQLPGLIGESMSYAEGTAFISGSGSNAPRGIVTAISGTAGSKVTATTRGTFGTGSEVDVFALLNAVPSRYEDSTVWVANKTVFNTIRQMPAGSGATSAIWPDYEAALGRPLLGSPTVSASDMTAQASLVSGSIGIVLGDWSQFVIYDRLGTSVEFVQNVFNSSAQPLGQRGLVAHKRVGSDVTDANAFRFLLV